ncbi:lipid kinase YegS/Rv2252/BmrU family [Mycoplasma sp. CAG:877]|nr:lipid kinase YegS/Rv2252/BmrU family [Mycoplasma sp. CAG:877]
MKHIFIVNPISGKGKTLKAVDRIKKVCEEENLDYEIYFTEYPKDATKIARKYRFTKNIIYSVGGDGTLNEVLNGIVGTKNLLGVIPAGSGNDFYKTLSKIDEEYPVIDIGKVNDRYFINIISIGIDAEVANNVSLMKKRKVPTNQIYNASLIYTFFKYKYKDIELSIDEKEQKKGKCTILTICNGQVYGGGYKIAPSAKLTDGYFDVYYVEKVNKPQLPSLINMLKQGIHEKHNKVHKSQATKIKFKCDKELVCNIDGEIMTAKKFNVKIIPNAITIYNNKELIKKFTR